MTTVLIIEDEINLNKILSDYLGHNGFKPISAHTGGEGLRLWQEARPDLILLDLNLPGMDGLDVARTIRKTSRTPIIMVTARQEELDRLIGLELGADDYISKPFSPREVVARVKAVLRRRKNQAQSKKTLPGKNHEIAFNRAQKGDSLHSFKAIKQIGNGVSDWIFHLPPPSTYQG